MISKDELIEVFKKVIEALDLADNLLCGIERDGYVVAPYISRIRGPMYLAHNMRVRILVGGLDHVDHTSR